MATHPLTTSLVRAFMEALAEWADAPWTTPVDIPFITTGCPDRSVKFDLRFRMLLPDGDSVLITDPVVGRMLRQEGVERAIAPRRDEVQGPNGARREESRGSEALAEKARKMQSPFVRKT